MLDNSSMHLFLKKETVRRTLRFGQWFSEIIENKNRKGKRKLNKNNYLILQNPNQELIVISKFSAPTIAFLAF